MKIQRIYWIILTMFFILTATAVRSFEHPVTSVDLENFIITPAPTSTPKPTPIPTPTPYVWDGPVLNAYIGTVEGPSGKETYYNLPMDGVIYYMRELGYDELEYPYWVRADGCKMLGNYIMCAAALDIRPKGTILESSLGTCIVCDTGEFVNWNHTQIDIAVNW